jgi:hypothetical protein
MPLFAIARWGEPKKPFVLVDATSRARASACVAGLDATGVLKARGYYGSSKYHLRHATDEQRALWLAGKGADPDCPYVFLLPLHWPNRRPPS